MKIAIVIPTFNEEKTIKKVVIESSAYGNVIVEVNKRYFRNTEVDTLLGDANKAKKKLGWECKINFNELVSEMTNFDLNLAKKEKFLMENFN